MVTRDPLTYTGGTTHRPIPLATDVPRRTTHTPPTKKPAGIDFDALVRRCDVCGQKKTGRLTNGMCTDCTAAYAADATADIGRDPDAAQTQETAAETSSDVRGWQIVKIPGFSMGKQWMAVTPGCPTGAHPTRDCGCRAVATVAEARSYIAFQLDDGAPAYKDSRAAFIEAHAPKVEEPTPAPQPITPQVKAKIRQISPDDITITLRGPGLAHRQTEIASLLGNLLAGLHQTPAPASAATSTAQGREKREGARKGKPAPSRATSPREPSTKKRGNPGADVDEQAIIREYQDGETAPALAKKHGCQPARIRRILDRNGIERRNDLIGPRPNAHRKWATEEIDDIVASYTRGETSQDLARRYNASPSTILRLLRERDVDVRPANNVASDVPPETVDAMVHAYRDGASLKALGQRYGIRHERVRGLLVDRGVELRPSWGPKQPVANPSADIRAWAHEQGLLDPTQTSGRLPRAVLDAYLAAHPTPTEKESTTA